MVTSFLPMSPHYFYPVSGALQRWEGDACLGAESGHRIKPFFFLTPTFISLMLVVLGLGLVS